MRWRSMMTDWARPVVHWEIRARDPGPIREFYAALFNWEIGDAPGMRISAGIGGPQPGPGGHIARADAPGVVLHVQVRDLDESLRRASELGGSVLRGPRDLPAGTTVALIADPEGNRVGLVQQ